MKESFLPADSQAHAYVHTHSRGAIQEAAAQVNQDTHKGKKIFLFPPSVAQKTTLTMQS